MALVITRTRVCDVTGDDDAKKTYITVQRDGEIVRWKLDLAKTGMDLLEEQLLPVISKATLVTDGDEPDEDDDLDDGPAAEKWSAPELPTVPVADDGVEIPELTPEERVACRAWAKRAANWQRCNMTGPPSVRGRISAAFVQGWIEAGRPVIL